MYLLPKSIITPSQLLYINIKTVIFMLLGFFLSRFTIVDGVAPFGIAFFLFFIKFDQYKYPVFLSTLAGVLLSFPGPAGGHRVVDGAGL